MDLSSRIAVVLPPREHFRAQDAGAVALTVKDFYLASSFKNELVVFGGFSEHFPDILYYQVKLSLWRVINTNFAYANACIRDLKHRPIQLVEVHNRAKLALRIKTAMPQLKVAVYLHNDPHSMKGLKTIQERTRLLECLDLVYCVSEFVKARLLEGSDPIFRDRVKVIYNAIPQIKPLDYKNRRPWIVYAGRFIPEKGVLELAEALAQLLPLYPDWKVVFLGAWGFGHEAGKSEYEQLVYAALAKVGEQVDFQGHVSHQQVIDVFSQASIAVTPSTGLEAFGRTTLEAMLAGCAVITSTSGGLNEVAGEAAVLVNPVNQDNLFYAMKNLIQDSAERETCASRCQKHAHTTFYLPRQVSSLDASRTELLH